MRRIHHTLLVMILAWGVAPATGLAQEKTPPEPAPAAQSGKTPDEEPAERPAEQPAEQPAARKPEPPSTMPTVIVSEKGATKPRYRTPMHWGGGRAVIAPGDVRTAGVQSAQDLLRLVPGIVTFDESGSDSKPNIGLRGSPPQRSTGVSLLADGIPLAPAPYGHSGQSIFPLTSERIYAVDVIRGGYTVRYGPNTVAGVINFLTRPIPERRTFEQYVRVNQFGDFSSYTGLGGQFDEVGLLLEAVEKVGQTHRRNGEYQIFNGSLKSSIDFSDSVRLLLQLEYFEDDSRQSDGISPAQYDDDPHESQAEHNWFYGNQLRGNFALEWDVAADQQIKLLGFASGGEREFAIASPRQAEEAINYIQYTPRPMTAAALEAQYFGGWELSGDVRFELGFGTRYQREIIKRYTIREPYPAGAAPTLTYTQRRRFNYDAFAMFVDGTLRAHGLTVVAGARMETLYLRGRERLTDNDNSERFFHVLPAFSATYALTPGWSVYTNAQNAFLPPQAGDLDVGATGKLQDFEAQTAWTFEGGTRGRFFDGLLAPDVCAFFTWFEDKLETNPFNFNKRENVGESRQYGLEFRLESEFGALAEALDGLRCYGTLTLQESEVMEGANNNNHLALTPRRLASWGLEYKHATGLYGKVDGTYTGWCYADSGNTRQEDPTGVVGKQRSATVWGARLGYQGIVLPKPEIELGLEFGVNNVFDAEYYFRRSGKGIFPGAPRNAYGAVRVIFRF